MSKAGDLPPHESDALLKILQEEVVRSGGQRAAGMKLGYDKASAGARVRSATEERKRVGLPMALLIYEHILKVSREEFVARLEGRAVPPSDVPFATIQTWVTKTKGVARAIEKYGKDITTFDLLRLHASPARHGQFEPDEIYAHIKQLRAGGVLEIGREVGAEEIASGVRAARSKAKAKS